MTVSVTLTQTETKDKTELDFPRAYEGQGHTGFVVTMPASSEHDTDATVCVLTGVGSVEEENINFLLEQNEESIAAGNGPTFDLKVTGEIILPNMYKLANPDKFDTYCDALNRLSLSDEDVEMPDMFLLASSVEPANVDDPRLHTFSAASSNVYSELVQPPGKEPFTSYKVSFAGQNPEGNMGTGNHRATLSTPDVRECVKSRLELEGSYLANSIVAGNIGFYTQKKDGEIVVRFAITKLYPGITKIKTESGSLDTRSSVPLNEEVVEPPKEVKDAKSTMLAMRKARQEKEAAEAPALVEDF